MAVPAGTPILVSVNTTGVGTGTSTGYIYFNGGAQIVQVTLNIGVGGNVTVTAGSTAGGAAVTSLSFTGTAGRAPARRRRVCMFRAPPARLPSPSRATATTSGGNWLR